MPRQNRVLPTGEIVALPLRGRLTGNRGCLHDEAGRLRRRWTTHAWIACRLEWRGRRRQIMAPGRWTELFFLDETVALAAGHRPCALCRREDYRRFRAAWAKSRGLAALPRAPEIDAVLHAAHTGPRDRLAAEALPAGAFARDDDGGIALACGRGRFLAWSDAGHGAPRGMSGTVTALTPAPMRQVLAAGYVPELHPAAAAAMEGAAQ